MLIDSVNFIPPSPGIPTDAVMLEPNEMLSVTVQEAKLPVSVVFLNLNSPLTESELQ